MESVEMDQLTDAQVTIKNMRRLVRERRYNAINMILLSGKISKDRKVIRTAIAAVAILGQHHQVVGHDALRQLVAHSNSLGLKDEANFGQWCLSEFVFIGQRFAGIPDMPV